MGRTLTLTDAANSFTQGLNPNNVEIRLFTLGGKDQINLNRSGDLGGGNFVDAGAGNDIVINFKEFGNIIKLGLGNDTYIGRGFGNFSTDLIDQVFAGAGNDRIAVETAQSVYFGQSGNDSFFSAGKRNTFNGGTGTDSISYAPRDDDFSQGGEGVTINLAQGFAETGPISRERLISIENATGSGAGDALIGSAGANRLEGAGGFDDLQGNGGADRFVFAKVADSAMDSQNFDLIHDFTRAQGDKIVLAPMDANQSASGNQAFAFIGAAAFSGAAGQLRFESFTDGAMIEGDVNGDGFADFQIGVATVTSMLRSDFIL